MRGFSLQDAGNFRINGAYYVRVASPTDPTIGGVTTCVGINALSTDFPAPSGIVDYHLREPTGRSQATIETGVLEYEAPYVNLSGELASNDGTLGIVAGLEAQPELNFGDDNPAQQYDFGLVTRWKPSANTSLTGYMGVHILQVAGDYAFITPDAALPPVPYFPRKYGASWGQSHFVSYTGGAIAKSRRGPWDLQASIFYSDGESLHSDFTILNLNSQGIGEAIGIRSRAGDNYATSAEVKLAHKSQRQRLYASLRLRDSENDVRPGVPIDLGSVDERFRTPPTPLPQIGSAPADSDHVRQYTIGIGDEIAVTRAFDIRLGLQDTRYERTFVVPGVSETVDTENHVLYDAAAIYQPFPRLTIFATTTRGLEETGLAPANATNRNEALPAALATQYEFGARWRLKPHLSLIGSLFQIQKPTPGLDAQGVYRLLNQERHRGIELSLAGEVAKGLTVVLGAVALDPKISSPLVASGAQSDRPVSVARVLGVASFGYEIPWVSGLSIDSQVSYQGRRPVHASGDLTAPAYALVDIGATYRTVIAHRDIVARLYVSNIADDKYWIVLRSELFYRTDPRAFRATITVPIH